jgi:hypothetical protein
MLDIVESTFWHSLFKVKLTDIVVIEVEFFVNQNLTKLVSFVERLVGVVVNFKLMVKMSCTRPKKESRPAVRVNVSDIEKEIVCLTKKKMYMCLSV